MELVEKIKVEPTPNALPTEASPAGLDHVSAYAQKDI